MVVLQGGAAPLGLFHDGSLLAHASVSVAGVGLSVILPGGGEELAVINGKSAR